MSFRINVRHTPTSGRVLDFRRALFEFAAADPEGSVRDWVREAHRDVLPERSRSTLATVDQCREWLDHPELWSPFPDEIALERARHFDWDVIENLSHLEYQLLVEHLAQRYDPFDAEHGVVKGKTGARGGEWSMADEVTPDQVTARRQAFLDGTPEQRARLMESVERYLRRRKDKGAA